MTQQAEKTVFDIDGHHVSTINGAAATSPATAPVYNPATGQVIAQVPVTTRACWTRRSPRPGPRSAPGRRGR